MRLLQLQLLHASSSPRMVERASKSRNSHQVILATVPCIAVPSFSSLLSPPLPMFPLCRRCALSLVRFVRPFHVTYHHASVHRWHGWQVWRIIVPFNPMPNSSVERIWGARRGRITVHTIVILEVAVQLLSPPASIKSCRMVCSSSWISRPLLPILRIRRLLLPLLLLLRPRLLPRHRLQLSKAT